MPVGVVKHGEESKWSKAKKLAAQQGHAKDWPYINGIFQKMKGGDEAEKRLQKSEVTPWARGEQGQPKFIISNWPGQVPNKARLEEMKIAKEMAMPMPFNPAMLFNPGGTYMTPSSVVDGLGFDRAQESDWRQFMGKALSSPNELTLRQSMLSKMLNERLDAPRRRALFGRALSYYRDMRKSMVNVVTVDDLRKSDTYGGIVDNFQQGDPEARVKRVREVVCSRVEHAEPKGLSLDKIMDVVKGCGRDVVAHVLTTECGKGGSMTFKKGMLHRRG
jgi:hypothetical protein